MPILWECPDNRTGLTAEPVPLEIRTGKLAGFKGPNLLIVKIKSDTKTSISWVSSGH